MLRAFIEILKTVYPFSVNTHAFIDLTWTDFPEDPSAFVLKCHFWEDLYVYFIMCNQG